MERLTEPHGTDYFRVRGNETVYNRHPKKSSRVAYALAKLFQMEELAEPKKIIRKGGFYGGLACPNCEEVFTTKRYPKCPYCGQVIDWTGDEN